MEDPNKFLRKNYSQFNKAEHLLSLNLIVKLKLNYDKVNFTPS